MLIGDAYKSGNLIFVVNTVSPKENTITVKCLENSQKLIFKLYGNKYYNTTNTNIQLGEKCDIGKTISPNINGKISLLSKYKV